MFIGNNLIELESVDSTNEYAAALLAKSKVPEGTAITAGFQSSGKGAAGNRWQSHVGENLLVSVILYPTFLAPRHQFFLNQAISLAVADTVIFFLPQAVVHIKWPNDVFADEHKVAGILIENSIQGQQIQHSIVGIGLNVNQVAFESGLLRAASLCSVSEKTFSIAEVRNKLFAELEKRYLQLKMQHINTLQKEYIQKLYRLEEESLYRADGKRFNARIAGLTAEGKLILQTGDRCEVFGFKEVEMIY